MEWFIPIFITTSIIIVLTLIIHLAFNKIINDLVRVFCIPYRQSQPETPSDYNLDYKNITLKTRDGISLSGWHIKSTGNKLAIFSHPGSMTKWGWNINDLGPGITNKSYGQDVRFLPFIKHLVNAGYDVIMYDQRNHGESDFSPSGYHDIIIDGHLDVVAAVEYTMTDTLLKHMPKALVLFCQSSYSAMVAMKKYPTVFKQANIKAFTANQPTGLRDFFLSYGIPGFMVNAIDKSYIEHGLKSLEENEPHHWTDGILYPTFFSHNTADPWTSLSEVNKIYDSITTEKEGFFVAMEPHRFAAYNYFNDHPEPLITFLEKHINT